MKTREVIPLKQKPNWEVSLPGSKSITNRVFMCAALAKGKSRIYGALKSDDAEVMLKALRQVGIKIKEKKEYIEITGGTFNCKKATLDLHNAGTATRFLTATMTLRKAETIVTGCERMKERPIGDLVDGLSQLGVEIEYLKKEGFPPIAISPLSFLRRRESSLDPRVKPEDDNKKEYFIKMKGNKSSQYFTALLMLAPCLDKPVRIEVIGDLVSKPYINITLSVLKQFGIKVKNNNYQSFLIKPQTYKAGDYLVEGDASGASYWASIAGLHDGKVKFTNLKKTSVQGDIKYGNAFENCKMKNENSVIDMTAMPDAAMTLAVSAPFFCGQTKITGLSTLRIKETDRLAALENELKKVGVKVKTTKDSIAVENSKFEIRNSKLIHTYNDHRMAMCFAVVGTKIPGIVIEDPDCTDKTYPTFWEDLERAYLSPIKLGKKNLILTGMRCSGKSFYGKKIAKILKRPFVDIDREIERFEKKKIRQIIDEKGWDYFRFVESEICRSLGQARDDKLVIATGGGVILNPQNMKALKKNAVNVFIFADIPVLIDRIKKQTDRPSLIGKDPSEELAIVWKDRRDLYLKYADIVWDNTSGKVAEENLDKIFG